MQDIPWVGEFFGNITVCHVEGIIPAMNDRAAEAFAEEGGLDLIGRNLLDCHPNLQ